MARVMTPHPFWGIIGVNHPSPTAARVRVFDVPQIPTSGPGRSALADWRTANHPHPISLTRETPARPTEVSELAGDPVLLLGELQVTAPFRRAGNSSTWIRTVPKERETGVIATGCHRGAHAIIAPAGRSHS